MPRKPKPISPPKKHHAELVDGLNDYASKTPDAIIRKRVFKEPGIREDDLAATQPEERDASEKQIAEAIKRASRHHRDDTEGTASGSQAADTQGEQTA